MRNVALPALALALAISACTGGVNVEDLSTNAPAGNSGAEAVAADEGPADSDSAVSTTVVPTTVVPTTVAPTTTEPPDPIELLIEAMTLEARIGQMLMPVVSGTDAVEVNSAQAAFNQSLGGAATPAELVSLHALGGVLYLGPNIIDAAQVAKLSEGMQNAAPDRIGLLVAVDQEGGRVNRITDGVTVAPSARSLAPDGEAVRQAAETTAIELSALGINVVLAPVADITGGNSGVIGDRSYGDDPQVVAEMVTAAIDGLSSGGVGSAVKHWPGHGATAVDSHRRLPVLDVSAEQWRSRERVPFDAAVGEGVDMVMVGHLAIPSLDSSQDPATVSSVMLEGLLRDDLGYQGIIITDALDMGAVASFDRAELAVRAVAAGVDILLVTPNLVAARDGLLTAVEEGRLAEQRINDSVERILRLKLRLGLLDGIETPIDG